MDVKLVARTLDLFELFANEQRPLPLNQLARGLDVPMSSCLALVRTLVNRGYLVEVRRRGGYYPTPRLLQLGMAIKAVDPVVEMMRDRLAALRDETGETVVLGRIYGNHVLYLDVAESTKPVRYSIKPGEKRPVHANSIGKAIFGAMEPEDAQALRALLSFERFTPRTAGDEAAFITQVEEGKRRGWHVNIGGSFPELSAVAVAVKIGGEIYGVSIAGPTERIEAQQDRHGAALLEFKAAFEGELVDV